MGLLTNLRFSPESVCALALSAVFWYPAAVSPERARAQGRQNFDTVKAEIHPVQGKVYMLTGAGGNVTVQEGPDGVLLVDTQFAPMAPKILAAIRELTDKPIRYIINTHVHGDHTGGNEAIAKSVQDIKIIGHENLLKVMSAPPTHRPFDFSAPRGNWPTETYKDQKTLEFNGEEVELIHSDKAHSSGDTIVFFHGSNVVSAGDVYANSRYPTFDPTGSIGGVIIGMNRILGMITPPDKRGQGGTVIIPGHGPIAHQADLVAYRDMAVMLRDRIQTMLNQGMTLEQVKAMHPMKEYDPIYGGPTTGIGSADGTIEEIYDNLAGFER
jgi:glyoxylase-like metal-dependent hydrolase (beta-lactamase superfamily II)